MITSWCCLGAWNPSTLRFYGSSLIVRTGSLILNAVGRFNQCFEWAWFEFHFLDCRSRVWLFLPSWLHLLVCILRTHKRLVYHRSLIHSRKCRWFFHPGSLLWPRGIRTMSGRLHLRLRPSNLAKNQWMLRRDRTWCLIHLALKMNGRMVHRALGLS